MVSYLCWRDYKRKYKCNSLGLQRSKMSEARMRQHHYMWVIYITHKNCRKSWTKACQQASMYWKDNEPIDDVVRLPKTGAAMMEIEDNQNCYEHTCEWI